MSDPTGGWDFSRFTGGGGTTPGDDSSRADPAPRADAFGASFGGASSTATAPLTASAGFGGAVATEPAPSSVRSPIGWLIGGVAVAALAGAAALVLGADPLAAILSWAFAGPIAIGLFAVYLLLDTRRRTQLMYSPPTWAPWLYRGGLIIVLLAVIASAARIAFWAGRVWQL
ncbi:hypothetical protein [Rathayibacter sp. VKM Ac-2801]|uniref:hypothetical protein n=1 Tax=Rathayibacter sp. VKM Ac-2801 TaxID=2609255 RepID=UPI0013202B07|nr:hypothetical protein [Rathayibacter sp. VKM Ac-2801]QHC69308.1 hypothetical protein GSU45_02180 [Rathayibacter sp. VKM Ac-2801]